MRTRHSVQVMDALFALGAVEWADKHSQLRTREPMPGR
jgi:hypothetical protein